MAALVSARDVADIQAALAPGGCVQVVGSGSKRGIGGQPQATTTIDCSGLSGVNFFEPAEMALSVKAGTRLSEIEATLAAANHRLAFEPASQGLGLFTAANDCDPTAAGMVATNASGSGRIARGALRDHLLGIEAVNGRGELIKNGGRVMKNVTGLDLCKVVAGSWGTLAVITELVLKTAPRAELERTLVVRARDTAHATEIMTSGLTSAYDLTAAAYDPNRASVLLRLEGIESSVVYRTQELSDLLRQDFSTLNGSKSIELWRDVSAAKPLLPSDDGEVWRLSVAPQVGGQVLERAKAEQGAEGFLDWGGGLVWLKLPVGVALNDGRALLGGLSGNVMGMVSGARAFPPRDAAATKLAKGIKAAFDPRALLNPNRLYESF